MCFQILSSVIHNWKRLWDLAWNCIASRWCWILDGDRWSMLEEFYMESHLWSKSIEVEVWLWKMLCSQVQCVQVLLNRHMCDNWWKHWSHWIAWQASRWVQCIVVWHLLDATSNMVWLLDWIQYVGQNSSLSNWKCSLVLQYNEMCKVWHYIQRIVLAVFFNEKTKQCHRCNWLYDYVNAEVLEHWTREVWTSWLDCVHIYDEPVLQLS